MSRRRRLLPALAVVGAGVLLLLALRTDLGWLEGINTYGNFDVPGRTSFVHRLWPGIPDSAAERVYRFGEGIHATPVVALGAIFLVFLLVRAIGSLDVRLGIYRWLTGWAAFVVARFGLARVAGGAPVRRCTYGIFPFLNCQACEMASGGCPIGALQASLMEFRLPVLPLVVMALTGLALGRWICGWLCPFGLLSDIFDRFSKRRWRPSIAWSALSYVALGVVVVAPLLMGAVGLTTELPFCSTLCASGSFFGLLPYYATTGAPDFGAAFTAGHGGELMTILFHAAVFAGFLFLAVKIAGRVFCRYACPLGAFLGLFHRISLVRVLHVGDMCTECGKCEKKCPMGINLADPAFLVQSQCIRCGRCVALCPGGARTWSFGLSRARPAARAKERALVRDIPSWTDSAR